MEPDPLQEIYGMPNYISALQSGLLNENATLFRRRYYLNGSHAGFILYVRGGHAGQRQQRIAQGLARGQGAGNFRNLFLHIPGGKADGVKIMPIAEVGANDQFLNIKR
jgi:capsid portal protein